MRNKIGREFRTATNDTERLFRIPDAVGNLYRTSSRTDRKYGAGSRLLESEDSVSDITIPLFATQYGMWFLCRVLNDGHRFDLRDTIQ